MPQKNHKTAVMFPTFEFPTSSWHLSAAAQFCRCTGHWPELKSSGPNWEEVPQAWQLRLWDPKAADGPITDITSPFRKGNNMLEMLEIAIHSNPFHPTFGSVGNKLNAMEFLWIKMTTQASGGCPMPTSSWHHLGCLVRGSENIFPISKWISPF